MPVIAKLDELGKPGRQVTGVAAEEPDRAIPPAPEVAAEPVELGLIQPPLTHG